MQIKCHFHFQKHKFIRFLMKQESYQRKRNWLKSAAEWSSKGIVSLELSLGPVISARGTEDLDGVSKVCATFLSEPNLRKSLLLASVQILQMGPITRRRLRDVELDPDQDDSVPVGKFFISSAPAILVALCIAKQQAQRNSDV